MLRAQLPTANIAVYANAVGLPVAIDKDTVEFRLPRPDPVFLQHMDALFIMSRAWCDKHKVAKPLDFKNKEETYAIRNAMGTGAFMLVSREPDVKTVLKKNPNWWGLKEGRFEGNVDEVVYRPIKQAGTRVASRRA